MKNFGLLITGVVLTILFLLFSTQIYEILYYSQNFSNWMYNNSMYLVIAIVTVLVSWGIAFIYYYLINSVRFDRWYHWLLMLLASILLAPCVDIAYSNSSSSAIGTDFSSDILNFAIINILVTAIFFIIASFSIRWWSYNCNHTPIPQ